MTKAEEILSKYPHIYGNKKSYHKISILSAMKEIAELAFDAGRISSFMSDTSDKKEQWINQNFNQ